MLFILLYFFLSLPLSPKVTIFWTWHAIITHFWMEVVRHVAMATVFLLAHATASLAGQMLTLHIQGFQHGVSDLPKWSWVFIGDIRCGKLQGPWCVSYMLSRPHYRREGWMVHCNFGFYLQVTISENAIMQPSKGRWCLSNWLLISSLMEASSRMILPK